jgi:hypothetical protein
MQNKAVLAYRKAEEMGESLAMSNLGYKLASIGMLLEAREKCDQAIKVKDYHKNVASLLARLSEIPEEEDKKEGEVLEKVRPAVEFLRSLGRSITRVTLPSLPNKWQGPVCSLEFQKQGSSFRLFGNYERDDFGLLIPTLGGQPPRKTKHHVEYVGTLSGMGMFGVVKRGEGAFATGSATSIEGAPKALMVISDGGEEIKVMEKPDSSNPQFYSLKKISDAGS